ncbi:Uncharacterised protein [Staphylococcus aureus]|nr:Uncharacterised protein [Staphylococcus aureus]
MAGAIFHAANSIGKFQATTAPTTPIGSCRTILIVSLSISFTVPSSVSITLAK